MGPYLSSKVVTQVDTSKDVISPGDASGEKILGLLILLSFYGIAMIWSICALASPSEWDPEDRLRFGISCDHYVDCVAGGFGILDDGRYTERSNACQGFLESHSRKPFVDPLVSPPLSIGAAI